MKTLLKILKKLIFLIIFIIVAIVSVYFVYKGIIKMEFKDSIKYTNINYSDDNICLTFNNDSYTLNNCDGSDSGFGFDSNNECSMYYSRGYNSLLFDCGIKNINLVKLDEFSFNKLKFNYKDKNYTLINKSVFSTMDGLQKVTFTFLDEKNIKFSKYLDNSLVDEEVCSYKFSQESMGLECKKFYGYSAFIIDKFDGNSVTVVNRNNKIVFNITE